jgi:hypothetical protein
MPGLGIAKRGFGKVLKKFAKKADKVANKESQKMLSQIVRGQHSPTDKVKRNKAFERTKGISKLAPVVGVGIATTDLEKDPRVRKAEGGRTAAWQRKEGKNPSGGLNQKGRDSYKGGTLKAPTKSKTSGRRKSFCARMGGMKKRLTSAKTARDPNSRINKALRKWDC